MMLMAGDSSMNPMNPSYTPPNQRKTWCIYGESGSGKSTLTMRLVKHYVNKFPGSRGLVCSADMGGTFEHYNQEGLIDSGQVLTCSLIGKPNPMGVMNMIMDRYWPRPVIVNGEYQELIGKVQDYMWDYNNNPVSAYVFEGISTTIQAIKTSWARNQTGNVGFKLHNVYVEDGYQLGGLQEGHYGMMQDELRNLIARSQTLPCAAVIWTAHVGTSKDKYGHTVFCPQGAGSADNGMIPSFFQEVWHNEVVDVPVQDKSGQVVMERQFRTWFMPHDAPTAPGAMPIKFVAKTRLNSKVLLRMYQNSMNGVGPQAPELAYGFFLNTEDKGPEWFVELANYSARQLLLERQQQQQQQVV